MGEADPVAQRCASFVATNGECSAKRWCVTRTLSCVYHCSCQSEFSCFLSRIAPPARAPELVVVEERIDGKPVKGKSVTFLKIDSDAMDGNRKGWCFTRTPTGVELLMEVEIGSWVYRSAFAWKKPLLGRDGISVEKAQKTGAKIAFAAPFTEVDICERTRIQTIKGRKCRFLRLSAKSPVGGGSWLIDTNLSNGKALLILHETVEGADEAAERVVDEAESASKVRRQNKAIAQSAAGMERAVVRMRIV